MKQIGVVLCISVLMFLVGCQQVAQNEPELQENKVQKYNSGEVEKDSNMKKAMIKAKGIESYPTSLYDQTEFDFNRDGKNEQIEMYVNAAKDKKGEYVWDDGHNWLLVVKDGDQTYPLFDGWVQLGSLSFWLIESNETPMIILLKTGTAEFTIQTFTFNEEEKGFIQETHFNPDNVNFWYHSK